MPLVSAIAPVPAKQAGVLATSQARAIADMRAFLARRAPLSASESLRLLRSAFPDAPLSLRVAACGA
ncbi:hypothetical protein [Hansschlegelia zhihuaiae]|uniref:Uncharacterized protein n=1 Tax=Hansschlegelia zhihuaiae TaxID=405005 RepID=A0A4Q0MLR4_9HYPH|nr:hypothetical protein [Hansschlegelia zhihuaiae]RXF73996.1 hypothetical protein EK403_08495 [Hansschlegelia zhihuaiae]